MKPEITEELLDQLAMLSKLDVSGLNRSQLKQDLIQMIAYVNRLQSFDPDMLEPMTHFPEQGEVLREDLVRRDITQTALLMLAPMQERGYYLVPDTLQKEVSCERDDSAICSGTGRTN